MTVLAIGAVTKVLVLLLEKKLNRLLPTGPVRVTAIPPDDDRVDTADGVNLFLYRLTENSHFRNATASCRSSATRAPLSLDLHYLLTGYAKRSGATARDDITAQQVLGAAMAILHQFPVLNRIRDDDFDAQDDEQFPAELRDGCEELKITPSQLSLDELSKIWAGLNKAYRNSVTYDVSLVQIASQSGAASASPVGRLHFTALTLAAPRVSSVTPLRCSSGAELTVQGAGLRAPGCETRIWLDDVIVQQSELSTCSEQELRCLLPDVSYRRPQLQLRVSVGEQSSAPVELWIDPWLGPPRPNRAFPGLPVSCDYASSHAAQTVTVQIDGISTAATLDDASSTLSFTVPDGLALIGPRALTGTFTSDTGVLRSALQTLDVMPQVSSVTTAQTSAPVETIFTVVGQRLNGADVTLRVGGLSIQVGQNPDPNGFVARLGRALPLSPESESFVAVVDGRSSNHHPPTLAKAEPSRARPGESITLTGLGLSGRMVEVFFGDHALSLGSSAYETRLLVKVPELEAGDRPVSVKVDEHTTQEVQFEVLA